MPTLSADYFHRAGLGVSREAIPDCTSVRWDPSQRDEILNLGT